MKDLVEIIKQLPKGTKVYCTFTGEMHPVSLSPDLPNLPILLEHQNGFIRITPEGKNYSGFPNAECCIWPTKDHRTWADWHEVYNIDSRDPQQRLMMQAKFDPFDPILVRNSVEDYWRPRFFSALESESGNPFLDTNEDQWRFCINYFGNEHLAWTTDNPLTQK